MTHIEMRRDHKSYHSESSSLVLDIFPKKIVCFSFLILRILDNLCFITHNTVLHGEYLFIKLTNYPPSKLADILFL